MGWRNSEIIKLIHLYREYEYLWNSANTNYNRADLKKRAWLQIAQKCGREVVEVKKKIKHLRNTYVVEKKKIYKLKKSGKITLTSPYVPRLFYFAEMCFLDSVVVLRKPESNLDTESPEFGDEVLEAGPLLNAMTEDDPLLPTPTRRKPVRCAATSTAAIVSRRHPYRKCQPGAINDIAASANAVENDDVFTCFARTIAHHLKQLPMADATMTMSEIHNFITAKVLANLAAADNSLDENGDDR